jgi:hypothetical protein
MTSFFEGVTELVYVVMSVLSAYVSDTVAKLSHEMYLEARLPAWLSGPRRLEMPAACELCPPPI